MAGGSQTVHLYAAPGSCSLCAHIALIEAGMPHAVTHVVLRSPSSPLAGVNPLGKVPTLVLADGEVVTQSAVVLPLIADLATQPTLLARGGPQRRRALEWLAFFNADVHPALKMLAGAERYTTDPASLRESHGRIARTLFEHVETALGSGTWLTGPAFTIADAYAGTAFNWARQYGSRVEDLPRFGDLAARFEARPSVRAARDAEVAFIVERRKPLAFMSPEWFAMAHEELATALAIDVRAQGARITIIERYRNVPADAPRPARGAPGVRIEIANGSVALGYGIEPGETADVEIDCTWADSWRSVCLKHGPELDALNADRLAEGRLAIRGNPGPFGALLSRVHDVIADRTVPPPAPRR